MAICLKPRLIRTGLERIRNIVDTDDIDAEDNFIGKNHLERQLFKNVFEKHNF